MADTETSDTSWKNVALSLERPYKGIRTLLDINPEGELIYEPPDELSKLLATRITRIIGERGFDFFDKTSDGFGALPPIKVEQLGNDGVPVEDDPSKTKDPVAAVTLEDLTKMRMELAPQLFIAMGEMSHAKELLEAITGAHERLDPLAQLASPVKSAPIGATVVTKPPPIVSVEAFNAQLAIGSKDEALRRAARTFKAAAESMERGRQKAEKYWTDALKVRRMNWGLVPAPLPFGTPTGKGADKTSKDFLISFGLEESTAFFKRRAIARIASHHDTTDGLIFPFRQNTRLRVSMTITIGSGVVRSQNTLTASPDGGLDQDLQLAQQEIIEQEIFSILVQEASNLPTASARVSERLIVIEATQGIELRLDLVSPDSFDLTTEDARNPSWDGQCDLVRHLFYAFLLRRHNSQRVARLGRVGVVRSNAAGAAPPLPTLLQPVIDLLQYHVFCDRVKTELDKVSKVLSDAHIPSRLRFDPVGDTGKELQKFLFDDSAGRVTGEAVLRIDNRYTMRLTLASPSNLEIHLPQVTQRVTSIPQLRQLISDEVERYLLSRIRESGTQICSDVSGTWFVDPISSRCVGKLEGCETTFSVAYQETDLQCTVFRLMGNKKEPVVESYSSHNGQGVIAWAEQIIKRVHPPSLDPRSVARHNP